MFCRDRSLTLLAKYGYNVVRLPRTGIEPLDVLGRDRTGVERLGRLPAIWDSQAQVPAIQAGDVATEIRTLVTTSLKASIGLRLLEDILGGLGAAVPRLDFAYGTKRSLQFTFGNIRVARVDPFEVGSYLKDGDLQTGNPWIARYFFDDGADAFVLTEALKSDTVTVSVSSDNDADVALDLAAIQNAVGAQVEVKAGVAKQSDISYRGPAHLTFAFKAFGIGFNYTDAGPGAWEVSGLNPKDGDVYLDGDDGGPTGPLLTDHGRPGRIHFR